MSNDDTPALYTVRSSATRPKILGKQETIRYTIIIIIILFMFSQCNFFSLKVTYKKHITYTL